MVPVYLSDRLRWDTDYAQIVDILHIQLVEGLWDKAVVKALAIVVTRSRDLVSGLVRHAWANICESSLLSSSLALPLCALLPTPFSTPSATSPH